MDFLFELILQVLGEFLLQVLVETAFEIGVRSLADTYRRRHNPLLATIGYAMWGAIAGGISLLFLPHPLVTGPVFRRVGLVAIPLMSAVAMSLIGRWREGKGQNLVKLDRFGYAFVFAFAMTLVRFRVLH